MSSPSPTDPRKLPSEELERLWKYAFNFALRRARVVAYKRQNIRLASPEVAEDAAACAMESLFGSGDRKWNPEKIPDMKQQLRSVINSELSNRAVSSHEQTRHPDGNQLLGRTSGPSDPEQLLIDAEFQKKVRDLLEEEVLQDERLFELYTAFDSYETDQPSVLAQHLGISVREVDTLKRKLRLILAKIFARLEAETRTRRSSL